MDPQRFFLIFRPYQPTLRLIQPGFFLVEKIPALVEKPATRQCPATQNLPPSPHAIRPAHRPAQSLPAHLRNSRLEPLRRPLQIQLLHGGCCQPTPAGPRQPPLPAADAVCSAGHALRAALLSLAGATPVAPAALRAAGSGLAAVSVVGHQGQYLAGGIAVQPDSIATGPGQFLPVLCGRLAAGVAAASAAYPAAIYRCARLWLCGFRAVCLRERAAPPPAGTRPLGPAARAAQEPVAAAFPLQHPQQHLRPEFGRLARNAALHPAALGSDALRAVRQR